LFFFKSSKYDCHTERRDFFTKGLNSRLDWKTPPKARICLKSNKRKNVSMSIGDEFVLFHSSTKNKTSMAVLAKNQGPQREVPFSTRDQADLILHTKCRL